ncbi:MAG: hypothetical protein A4E48_00076 [Methanosaeta sp. PtaU1.Bin060]|nr:MAG: hypothetical protein A4E45_02078 [Methanosaeta sp. PtaB.Bin039]OPY55387.1 MAG: hypothetical protein A4E48_00076 [Methanosaeta sp. PtaU1.Bin060]
MTTPDSFLAFWASGNGKTSDPAHALYAAHKDAVERIQALRASALSLIQPVKNAKGAWVPGFGPDTIDEAANIGSETERWSGELEAIADDIAAFLDLSDGRLTLTEFVGDRNVNSNRISRAEMQAAAAVQHAIQIHPGADLQELQRVPTVSEAYNRLKQVKDECGPVLKDMETRLSKIRELLADYA